MGSVGSSVAKTAVAQAVGAGARSATKSAVKGITRAGTKAVLGVKTGGQKLVKGIKGGVQAVKKPPDIKSPVVKLGQTEQVLSELKIANRKIPLSKTGYVPKSAWGKKVFEAEQKALRGSTSLKDVSVPNPKFNPARVGRSKGYTAFLEKPKSGLTKFREGFKKGADSVKMPNIPEVAEVAENPFTKIAKDQLVGRGILGAGGAILGAGGTIGAGVAINKISN
tara:strand:- start:1660 stop:2328 length:669 start_codon:yes stop_codon:yes gene_type:complete